MRVCMLHESRAAILLVSEFCCDIWPQMEERDGQFTSIRQLLQSEQDSRKQLQEEIVGIRPTS
jgi:hypothetical protein